jgi:hypothetical protein
MGVGGQRHTPAALPPGKTRYPLFRRLVGLQSRSERVGKISPPSGFDPRTVQPVPSRYTDYAIPAPICWSQQIFLLPTFIIEWKAKFQLEVSENCKL